MEFKFSGEKGSRKVVKTIDIHEESYEAIQTMLSSGENMNKDVNGPLLDDVYHIFGGNCYGLTVSKAIDKLIVSVVNELWEKKHLSVEVADACVNITDAIFPTMAYTNDEHGVIEEELRFFELDADAIITNVSTCLHDESRAVFVKSLRSAVKHDSRPAGEIALGILMYIASLSDDFDEEEEEIAN